MRFPFAPQTDLEASIMADPEWRTGAEWGKPRSGHPEGAVKFHIAEVLDALDRLVLPGGMRTRLRLGAIIHDTFKCRVDTSLPKTPPNEHGWIASRWAARYLDDAGLLTLIEMHDDGYRAWKSMVDGRYDRAEARIVAIIDRMGEDIDLFMPFYWADNQSGDKEQGQVEWLADQLAIRGVPVAIPRTQEEHT